MNYFSLFNLPETFNIKIKKLTKIFYSLQKKFHPDLCLNKNASIRIKTLKKSILINKGYKILKNPLKRSEHLLYINGITSISKQYKKRYEKFLKRQFYLYEKLDYMINNKIEKKKLYIFINQIESEEQNNMNKLKLYLHQKKWNSSIYLVLKLKFFQSFKRKYIQ